MFRAKTNYLLGICLLLSITATSYGQGSETALNFDGTNDAVNGHAADLTTITNNFTMEFWYNATATISIRPQQNGVTSISGTTGNGQRYAVFPAHGGNPCSAFGNAGMGVSLGSNAIQVYEHRGCYMPCLLSYSGGLIQSGWNHIAIVYTNKQPTLYVNGINAATGLTSQQNNVFPSAIIGGAIYGYYSGDMDEFRIWSTSRTQNQIRTNMCRKLTGAEAGLVRYYRFDDGAGGTATDATGTRNGSLTSMNPATDWVNSAAPIGDNSTRSYVGSGWTGATTLTLTNPAGQDALTVSGMSGTPAGVHVYGVSQVPNVTCGANGVGSNDRYFGVFLVNGTTSIGNPSYTVTYDYSNCPYVNATNEPNLDLANRSDNSVTTCNAWANIAATLNMPGDFLTQGGFTGANEIILSSETTPLPIELISFNALAINNSYVELDWQTATEINNDYFTIERSTDAVNWEQIATVNGAGNSSTMLNYLFADDAPYSGISYYRLKQTDYDGAYTYSITRTVNLDNTPLVIYPNPTRNILTVEGEITELEKMELYNAVGQSVNTLIEINKNKNRYILNLSNLGNGLYYIKTTTSSYKVCKH